MLNLTSFLADRKVTAITGTSARPRDVTLKSEALSFNASRPLQQRWIWKSWKNRARKSIMEI